MLSRASRRGVKENGEVTATLEPTPSVDAPTPAVNAPALPAAGSDGEAAASKTGGGRISRRGLSRRIRIGNNRKPPEPPKTEPGVEKKGRPDMGPSNEVDFGRHVHGLDASTLTFEVATQAFVKMISSTGHVDLGEENLQICAECRGGGDLLGCDCCALAFHHECLEPLERSSPLFVALPKLGLRKSDPTTPRTLTDSEWFCPYCSAPAVQRLWKRGVPQLLHTWSEQETEVVTSLCALNAQAPAQNGNLHNWCDHLAQFSSHLNPEDTTFKPETLLALSGIRRAVQRLGPVYKAAVQNEVERLAIESAVVKEVTAPEELEDPTIEEDRTQPGVKPPIMRSQRNSLDASADGGAMSDGENKRVSSRRSRRREEVSTWVAPPAKVNVGSAFQVPGMHKHYLEAKASGFDYDDLESQTVAAYLPIDPMGRVPYTTLKTLGSCRLVYSKNELAKRRERCSKSLTDLVNPNEPRPDQKSSVPLADAECEDPHTWMHEHTYECMHIHI